MAPAYVLRFPRTDNEGSFVLVNATQVRTKALDMKLAGTDGLAPYVVTLRHSQAASLMVKNCPVTEPEWIDILTRFLRQEPVEDMEAVANIEDESAITITFRKKVRGITQRLGTIELKHNPDEEIELFDWCGTSAGAVVSARESLVSVTAKTAELENSVRELRSQLDELIEAKKSDETEMLEKFRKLLNEKKVKIRQQQSILASAVVDIEPVPKTEPSSQTSVAKSRAADRSRQSKRKVPVQDDEDDEDKDDAGFDDMDVDSTEKTNVDKDADDGRQTTDDEETQTESEDDGREDKRPVTAPAQAKPKAGARTAQTATTATTKKGEEVPVRRDLPFLRKRPGQEKSAANPPPAEGSETESDEEL